MIKQFSKTILVIGFFFWPVLTQALITSEDLLKFRNLQYEQAKRVVRMQEIRAEYEKLNSENEKFKVEIESWVRDQAKKQNVDLKTHYFDSDQLKFVEIKQEKTNE